MTSETWERQRRTFERTAEAYDRFRPTYPDALFDDIRKYADLAPDDMILEVGAGTGRATMHFARWGNPIVAIEPAPAMADVARANLADFPNVDVRTARFEDATIGSDSFGLVACAQTWHWLDPSTRTKRFADALYAHGTAAIIANVQYATDESLPFFVRVQDVYREFSPENVHQGNFQRRDDLPHHRLENSGLFEDFRQVTHEWEWTLDAQTYIGLMGTHSNQAALEPDKRERLFAGIADLIDREFGGTVTENYVAVADLARRA